jgi:hypothetical protein
MHIEPTHDPNAHSEYPPVVEPVHVILDIPVYYKQYGDEILPVHAPIVCSRHLSETILAVLERELKAAGKALVHLGVYCQRMARHKDGTPIHPKRFSNHALGAGIDWAGYAELDGSDWWDVSNDEAQPLVLRIQTAVSASLSAAGLRQEIVNEGDWLHLGYFPPPLDRR